MWMHMEVVDYLAIVFLIARNERPLALSLVGGGLPETALDLVRTNRAAKTLR